MNYVVRLPFDYLKDILRCLDRFSLDRIEFTCRKLRAAAAKLDGHNLRHLSSLRLEVTVFYATRSSRNLGRLCALHWCPTRSGRARQGRCSRCLPALPESPSGVHFHYSRRRLFGPNNTEERRDRCHRQTGLAFRRSVESGPPLRWPPTQRKRATVAVDQRAFA